MAAEGACIFCQIVRGEAPCVRIAEDDGALAFLDIFPASEGHTLVIPKVHAENIFEIDAAAALAVAGLARRTAHALRAALAPEGLAIYQANGAAAGQTVWHYHVHLIPRHPGEGMLFHGRRRADEARLRELAGSIAPRVGRGPSGG
jgi:histidine triad (HIT) family protein